MTKKKRLILSSKYTKTWFLSLNCTIYNAITGTKKGAFQRTHRKAGLMTRPKIQSSIAGVVRGKTGKNPKERRKK